MFRVTQQNIAIESDTPVIFLQHGIGDSSDAFLVNNKNSVAFLLKEEGYDVWLGNSRGNRYSQSHELLTQEDPEFWQFSYQELGIYDKKAVIEEVLRLTGVEKLTYLGHSQGFTEMAVAIIEDGQFWKDKLNVFIAMSPGVFTEYLKTVNFPLRSLCFLQRPTEFIINLFGVGAIT